MVFRIPHIRNFLVLPWVLESPVLKSPFSPLAPLAETLCENARQVWLFCQLRGPEWTPGLEESRDRAFEDSVGDTQGVSIAQEKV